MKKLNLFFIVVTLLLLSSCGGSKKLTDKLPNGLKRTEIETPCGDYYSNTKDHIRAIASSKSPDQQNANDEALQNAKTRLASNISTSVISVFDQYSGKYTEDDRMDFNANAKNFTRQIVDQEMNLVNVVCQKNYVLENGMYETWIAIEMEFDQIGKKIYNKVNDEAKLKLDHEYEKFKEESIKAIDDYRENR